VIVHLGLVNELAVEKNFRAQKQFLKISVKLTLLTCTARSRFPFMFSSPGFPGNCSAGLSSCGGCRKRLTTVLIKHHSHLVHFGI